MADDEEPQPLPPRLFPVVGRLANDEVEFYGAAGDVLDRRAAAAGQPARD